MTITEQAQEILKERFPSTEITTNYIARYHTKLGRELALERARNDDIYLWVQRYNQEIEGVNINNRKYPGQPYGLMQSRNSNLNEKNTPKLKVGNKVYYLKIESLEAFNKVIELYSEV